MLREEEKNTGKPCGLKFYKGDGWIKFTNDDDQ